MLKLIYGILIAIVAIGALAIWGQLLTNTDFWGMCASFLTVLLLVLGVWKAFELVVEFIKTRPIKSPWEISRSADSE